MGEADEFVGVPTDDFGQVIVAAAGNENDGTHAVFVQLRGPTPGPAPYLPGGRRGIPLSGTPTSCASVRRRAGSFRALCGRVPHPLFRCTAELCFPYSGTTVCWWGSAGGSRLFQSPDTLKFLKSGASSWSARVALARPCQRRNVDGHNIFLPTYLECVLRNQVGVAGQQGGPAGRVGACRNDLTAGQICVECVAKCLAKAGRLLQNGAGGGDLWFGQQADFTQDGGGRTGKRCAGFIQDRTCYGIIGSGCLKYERGEGTELLVCVGDTGVEPGNPADPLLLCAAARSRGTAL